MFVHVTDTVFLINASTIDYKKYIVELEINNKKYTLSILEGKKEELHQLINDSGVNPQLRENINSELNLILERYDMIRKSIIQKKLNKLYGGYIYI